MALSHIAHVRPSTEKSCSEVTNLMCEVSYLAKDPVNAGREVADLAREVPIPAREVPNQARKSTEQATDFPELGLPSLSSLLWQN
jgi:hypothetical protein